MTSSKERTALALAGGLAMCIALSVLFAIPSTQAVASDFAEVVPPEANLEVAKLANPQPVADGGRLTYTLLVTNTGEITFTAAITDVLPAQVLPTGYQTWTSIIEPGNTWTQALVVTVTDGYTGPLNNQLLVTSKEGPSGKTNLTSCANTCSAALPLMMSQFSSYLPPRRWDPRLDDLGVVLEPATVEPSEPHWRLVAAKWADPIESAGRHNIFFEVLDEEEARVGGQEVLIDWPGGQQTLPIKPGPPPEWGADFPMFATLGAYGASVGGSAPSDRVAGMGMGIPEFPDVKYHTSFYLTYQWIP